MTLLLLQVQQALLEADTPASISYNDGWECWHSGGDADTLPQPKQQQQQQQQQQSPPTSMVLPAAADTSCSIPAAAAAAGTWLDPTVAISGSKCGIGSISEEQPHACNGLQCDCHPNAPPQSDALNTRDARINISQQQQQQPGASTPRAASSLWGSSLLQRAGSPAAAPGPPIKAAGGSAVSAGSAAAAAAGSAAGKKQWWRQLLRQGGSGQRLFRGLRIRMGIATGQVLRGQGIQGTTAYTCARGGFESFIIMVALELYEA
jgi:class 3 adenylate cyclase